MQLPEPALQPTTGPSVQVGAPVRDTTPGGGSLSGLSALAGELQKRRAEEQALAAERDFANDPDAFLGYLSGQNNADASAVRKGVESGDIPRTATAAYWNRMNVLAAQRAMAQYQGRLREALADTESWIDENGIPRKDLDFEAQARAIADEVGLSALTGNAYAAGVINQNLASVQENFTTTAAIEFERLSGALEDEQFEDGLAKALVASAESGALFEGDTVPQLEAYLQSFRNDMKMPHLRERVLGAVGTAARARAREIGGAEGALAAKDLIARVLEAGESTMSFKFSEEQKNALGDLADEFQAKYDREIERGPQEERRKHAQAANWASEAQVFSRLARADDKQQALQEILGEIEASSVSDDMKAYYTATVESFYQAELQADLQMDNLEQASQDRATVDVFKGMLKRVGTQSPEQERAEAFEAYRNSDITKPQFEELMSAIGRKDGIYAAAPDQVLTLRSMVDQMGLLDAANRDQYEADYDALMEEAGRLASSGDAVGARSLLVRRIAEMKKESAQKADEQRQVGYQFLQEQRAVIRAFGRLDMDALDAAVLQGTVSEQQSLAIQREYESIQETWNQITNPEGRLYERLRGLLESVKLSDEGVVDRMSGVGLGLTDALEIDTIVTEVTTELQEWAKENLDTSLSAAETTRRLMDEARRRSANRVLQTLQGEVSATGDKLRQAIEEGAEDTEGLAKNASAAVDNLIRAQELLARDVDSATSLQVKNRQRTERLLSEAFAIRGEARGARGGRAEALLTSSPYFARSSGAVRGFTTETRNAVLRYARDPENKDAEVSAVRSVQAQLRGQAVNTGGGGEALQARTILTWSAVAGLNMDDVLSGTLRFNGHPEDVRRYASVEFKVKSAGPEGSTARAAAAQTYNLPFYARYTDNFEVPYDAAKNLKFDIDPYNTPLLFPGDGTPEQNFKAYLDTLRTSEDGAAALRDFATGLFGIPDTTEEVEAWIAYQTETLKNYQPPRRRIQ